MSLLVIAVAAYLCGSLTFGLWLGKAIGRIDIREHGSRNIGATNVGRVLGAKWGVACLVLDALKGLLPTLLLPRLVASEAVSFDDATVLAAAATVVGHVFPVWLGFRGGKGVATGAGAAGVVSPLGLLAALTAFGAVFGLRRIVSLASLVAAVTYAAVAIATMMGADPETGGPGAGGPFAIAFAVTVPLLVVGRHAKNIGRLLRGDEGRLRTADDDRPADETDGVSG
ncbi:MAG: glycerol-3-phosphate 1-O-acyltransferase PlsY [Planctomycetota bacterium]